ncbi:hypothetical protein D0C36_00730 [Mucilaginibacter conchicola]|uniref:YdhG-like domain-containing protein n=1 Tax=Mucilaginibacter conchicola TaxID=2303333 RepID=A0A372NVH1_9SPHI|nr:DUF1801 domain-containing protein [Mucilaginibacter conchicola]RFZ94116.1 hypothetical protein D0C36_00730 [Mucilaginibacter conchicola]
MNTEVDDFIAGATKWPDELKQLRRILLNNGLIEDMKWRAPCYTLNNANIAIIGELKDCCVLSFFKGSLLQDEAGILTKPGENTQSARTVKFTGVDEIKQLESTLNAYIREAIENEKAGKVVDFKQKHELELAEELIAMMQQIPALKSAFEALTPGRQRAYNLYFTAPKQSKTRLSRVEACMPKILAGKGLMDR